MKLDMWKIVSQFHFPFFQSIRISAFLMQKYQSHFVDKKNYKIKLEEEMRRKRNFLLV